MVFSVFTLFFFFKQKTAYEMRISDWSSDVCSSDLALVMIAAPPGRNVASLGTNTAAVSTALTAVTTSSWPVISMAFAGCPKKSTSTTRASGGLAGMEPKNGRAAGRERGWQYGLISVVAVSFKKKKEENKNNH